MVKAKKFIYSKEFVGEPKLNNFTLVEEELPPVKDGQFLAEALYHSVDPYMRPYMSRYPVGSTMIGGQIAKIIESKNDSYPTGSIIYGHFGWTTHSVQDPAASKEMFSPYILPSFGDHPLSLGLGVLGMPGNTAYFGFLEICKPKPGDIVVVSGAAGAVGTVVGQIAKIKGCKVIGIAGSDDKCKYLKDELGFDHVINYKTEIVSEALKIVAPDGVDCYFDNVGGTTSSSVLSQMKSFGRISVCGSISSYNAEELPKLPAVQPIFIFKQLYMEGFLVTRWWKEWMNGINELTKWVIDGKIKYQETITEGFENMPQAFIDILQGKNTGKAIIKTV